MLLRAGMSRNARRKYQAEQKALSLLLAPSGSSSSVSGRSRLAGLGDGWRDKLRRAASAGFLGTRRLHSLEERRPRRRRSREAPALGDAVSLPQ